MKTTLYKLDEISGGCNEKIDLFICSSSFEDRCLLLPTSVAQKVEIKSSVICYIDGSYQSVIDHSFELEKILTNNSPKRIALNSSAPLKNAICINRELDTAIIDSGSTSVFIDATTFTHENLLIILRLLMQHSEGISDLRVGYVGAEEYDINELDPKKKWLSTGIECIRTVVGYPGVISPARKNHLIILFGFELDRTLALINSLEYNELSLGFGPEDDSIKDEHYWINRDRHQILLNQFANANSFCFSLTDPELAARNLKEHIDKFEDHNVVIAAMNNKVSTLGVALIAIDNPRIQVIYAKPMEYNTKGYSKSKDEAYIFRLI
jgi:hypothetical protein